MTAAASSAWALLGLLGNHLWQSTLFVGVVAVLTLAFRNNRPHVRYGLWCVASIKFLVPFAAFVALGHRLAWQPAVQVAPSPLTDAMGVMSKPFSVASAPALEVMRAAEPSVLATLLPFLLLAIWLVGCLAILATWIVQWRRMSAMVRRGSPVNGGPEWEMLRRIEGSAGLRRPIALIASNTSLEPGVFGIVNPVLLWSRGLSERLTDRQVESILAHEVSHVRRRDNLVAAVHMVVEAACWFHPLVWWVEHRLVDERERACDVDVIQAGRDPVTYAEGLLKVCELYAESPLTCVAGVTGSDLKERIEAIMSNAAGVALSGRRRLALTLVGMLAIVAPIAMGAVEAPGPQVARLTAEPESLAFDVASVRVNKSGAPLERGFDMPADRFEAKGLSLHDLIATAHGEAGLPPRWLADYQIAGGPSWMNTERFDVIAKTGTSVLPGTEGERRKLLMLRTLLAERFKLVVHHETRDVPIYALVLARSDGRLGPQIHRSDVDCEAVMAERRRSDRPLVPPVPGAQPQCMAQIALGGALVVQGQRMGTVADVLSHLANRLVVDRTRLLGHFDLDVQFSPEGLPGLAPPPGMPPGAPPSGSTDAPSIFTALQEQLGLKLESTRGPVDVLVIDHVERPTENQAGERIPIVPPSGQAPRSEGATVQAATASAWRADETDHFDVVYAAAAAAEIDRVKREVERAYNTASAERRHDIPIRPAVLVFENRGQMEMPATLDAIVASGATLPPVDLRILVSVDLSTEPRSAEILRQVRAIFERDIAGPSKPRAQAVSPAARGDASTFQVASVKANRSGDRRTVISQPQPGGRYTATNVPLDVLIAIAYQPLQRYEIDGVPDWTRSERFDIEAKADGNPTPAETWLMLQTLLAERFKLAAHRETRQLPVYALVLANSGRMGPQLRPHTDDTRCVEPSLVSAPAGGVPDSNAPDPSSGVSIFTAVQEQLGLKLVPQVGPVNVLVIDHVEKPSDN